MANSVAILDKIQRNCQVAGLVVSRTDSATLVAGGITITYVPAVIASPMGGIDPSVSPFLGIGIANPGKLNLDTNPVTLIHHKVFHICAGFANNIVIPLGEIMGSVDGIGLGQ